MMDSRIRELAVEFEIGRSTAKEFRSRLLARLSMLEDDKSTLALAEAIADYDDGGDE